MQRFSSYGLPNCAVQCFKSVSIFRRKQMNKNVINKINSISDFQYCALSERSHFDETNKIENMSSGECNKVVSAF